MKSVKLPVFLWIFLLLPLMSFAAVPAWQIQPAQSFITFTATQNNAPVTGEFKSFSGDINFDPNQLSASNVKIVVDLNSVSTSYAQIADTLKTADWFNTQTFPQATFTANSFSKTGNNTYQANGTLTIRDKTLPTVLTFTVENYSKTALSLKGSTTLKRTAFGVGQGQWANTDQIKDEVQVDFTVSAVSK